MDRDRADPSHLLSGAAICLLAGCASTFDECRSLDRSSVSQSPITSITSATHGALTCRAGRGDKAAQLELAKRFEMGNGVSVDLERAANLYRSAASAIPAKTAIYSPPVKVGGSGSIFLYDNPNATGGLAEARYRLGRMYLAGRGVPRDEARGKRLIEEAAREGFVQQE